MLQAPDASLLPPSASSTPAIAPDATPASRTPESARSARPAPRKRTRQAPSCSYLPRADDHVILIWVMALPLIVATGFPLLPDTRRHVREVMCLSDADLAALASKSARPRALGTYLNWSALRRAYVHLKGSPLLQRIRAFSAAHSEMTLRGSHACDGCTGPVGVGLQCSCGSTWHTACAVASLPSAEQLIVPQTSFLDDTLGTRRFVCLACSSLLRVSHPGPNGQVAELIKRICELSTEQLSASLALGRRFRGVQISRRRPQPDRDLFISFCRQAVAGIDQTSESAELALLVAPRLLLVKGESVL